MGYTHYWRLNNNNLLTDEQWQQIQNVAKQIIAEYEDILCYEYDEPEKSPLVDHNVIRFYGKGEEGHETFLLTRIATEFEFCKTAYKPYDNAVVDILKAVDIIAPDWLTLSSDGGNEVFA